MTIDDVRERLAQIQERSTWDDETAHGIEDGLYIDVLEAIANGSPDAPALAREALKARDIKFSRWYA